MKKFEKIDKVNRVLMVIGGALFLWAAYLNIAGNKGWLNFDGTGDIGFYVGAAPVLIYLVVMLLYPLAYLYGKVPKTGEPKTTRPLLYVSLLELIILAALVILVPHSHF